MARLLVIVLLVVVAVWLVRRALRRAARKDEVQAPRVPDELVRCAHCGLLLPRAEARQIAGAIYCSEEHATRGPGTR